MSNNNSGGYRRALVVGGTSGVGRGIALALSKRDIPVTIAGRSAEKGQAVLDALVPSAKSSHMFVSVDAFDLSSVEALIENQKDFVDLLVMTQGMASMQGYTPTDDGIDQKLQLHYFSRIHMAKGFAPHLAERNGRILTVRSAGVHKAYAHFREDFELKDNYSIQNAGDAAGYYTDAGFQKLSEEYPTLVVAHAAPGFVNTDRGTELPWWARASLRSGQKLFGRSLEVCGETLVEAWLDVDLEPGYSLIDPKGNLINGGIRHTTEERDEIWSKTWKLLPEIG